MFAPLNSISPAKCDWYTAGCPDGDFNALVGGLAETLNATPRRVDPKKGYQTVVALVDTTEGVQASHALVMTDHVQSPGRVLVDANGEAGGPARRFLIDNGVTHTVNRYDSAIDLTLSDSAFGRRMAKLKRMCDEQRRPTSFIQSTGRTMYYNVRQKTALTSPNQKKTEAELVFYEKGYQKNVDPTWKRLELRFRPAKPEAQAAAVNLEPAQVWGVFKWVRSMLDVATAGLAPADAVEFPRFQMSLPEVAEELRKMRALSTLDHMVEQYGRSYDTLVELMGEEEADRIMLAKFKRQHLDAQTPAQMYADLYKPALPTEH